MPADHDEIGTPAWEAMVLRRQAELVPAHAEGLRRRADELDSPTTAEPGTTDQRDANTEWLLTRGGPDLTDTVEVFALLRDIADAEPLVVILGAARCTMCGARDPEPNGGGHPPHPHPHRISCPWVRVTHLVGVKADA